MGDEVAAMKEITRGQFDAHSICRNPEALSIFTEKRWFEHDGLLAVIVFDHDGEWGWMVLAKSERYGFRGIDMRTNLRTQEEALQQLRVSFEKNAGTQAGDEPPMSKETAVRLTAQVHGISEDDARRGFEALKIPRPGNN